MAIRRRGPRDVPSSWPGRSHAVLARSLVTGKSRERLWDLWRPFHPALPRAVVTTARSPTPVSGSSTVGHSSGALVQPWTSSGEYTPALTDVLLPQLVGVSHLQRPTTRDQAKRFGADASGVSRVLLKRETSSTPAHTRSKRAVRPLTGDGPDPGHRGDRRRPTASHCNSAALWSWTASFTWRGGHRGGLNVARWVARRGRVSVGPPRREGATTRDAERVTTSADHYLLARGPGRTRSVDGPRLPSVTVERLTNSP